MFCPDGVVDIPEACGAKSAESLQPGFESRSGRFPYQERGRFHEDFSLPFL